MPSYSCPHCQTQTLGLMTKIIASVWGIVRCPNCGQASCAQPLVLGALYFLLVWDILLFGYVSFVNFQTQDVIAGIIYLAIMLTVIAILEFFALYVPLVAMRGRD